MPPRDIAHAVIGMQVVREQHSTGRGVEGLRLRLEFDALVPQAVRVQSKFQLVATLAPLIIVSLSPSYDVADKRTRSLGD